jgi:hypothetical protein
MLQGLVRPKFGKTLLVVARNFEEIFEDHIVAVLSQIPPVLEFCTDF